MNAREPHRREGRRRGLLGLAVVGCSVATATLVSGLKVWAQGDDDWPWVLVVGVAVLAVSVLVALWTQRTLGRSQRADALDTPSAGGSPPPFGARPRGDGLVLRPRAAIRLVPAVLPPLLALTAWGMWSDGLQPAAAVVAVLALFVLVVWWRARRYEICLDRQGIWRRHRPRWRLAWSDLHAVTEVPTSNRWHPETPPDLVLHGAVTTPGGERRSQVRLRSGLLAIAPADLRRLIHDHAARAVRGTDSPFVTWS